MPRPAASARSGGFLCSGSGVALCQPTSLTQHQALRDATAELMADGYLEAYCEQDEDADAGDEAIVGEQVQAIGLEVAIQEAHAEIGRDRGEDASQHGVA